MGHDVYAYATQEDAIAAGSTEVAYLRRAMWDDHRQVIYDLLDCGHHYGGCSGFGEPAEKVAITKIRQALTECPTTADREKDFLQTILQRCGDLEHVWIWFG